MRGVIPYSLPNQALYRKYGYEKEAQIRDFYAAGDDKVVFRKVFTVN